MVAVALTVWNVFQLQQMVSPLCIVILGEIGQAYQDKCESASPIMIASRSVTSTISITDGSGDIESARKGKPTTAEFVLLQNFP